MFDRAWARSKIGSRMRMMRIEDVSVPKMIGYSVCAVLVWVVVGTVVANDSRKLILATLGFLALAFAGRIIADWRSGFYVFLVWLLFEDLARKYMGNGTVFFFGKDVLFAIIVFSFLLEQRRNPVKLFRPPSSRVWAYSCYWQWPRYSIRTRQALFMACLA